MKHINILYLYPNEMNFYGDTGNVLTLRRRLEWRGFSISVSYHHPGEKFDHKPDIIVGGGGQDSGQLKVIDDLQKISGKLKKLADEDSPMLMICGMYQLFGHRFITHEGSTLSGIGIFDAETIGKQKRLIGNIVTETDHGLLVGYENHSGQTFLSQSQKPFGKVVKGFGNTEDKTYEGAQYKNVYGSYLHGSLLPKNPRFADALIAAALKRHGKDIVKYPIDDSLAQKARNVMFKRLGVRSEK